ncbi:hypothetical protein IPL85_02625 [Candidatus Saccharibacteria bacterium]|nr:MAG: hypothetical protein IPL85_02625 [Candidatus Saccharibacteria bacterium]
MPLPTVKINDGIVWDVVTKGNKVYATGCFNSVTDLDGSVHSRKNILAFDITTGYLDRNFVHSLSGASATTSCVRSANPNEGRVLALSPDGNKLFVGGTFTTVDGVTKERFAGFDISPTSPNGALLAGYGGVTNVVRAIAASNSTVYIGGSFGKAGGVWRDKLAAFSTTNGVVNNWSPTANAQVLSMVMAPGNTKVIFGGSFSTVNNLPYHSIAAVDAVTGVPQPNWASTQWSSTGWPTTDLSRFPINNEDPVASEAAIGSLTTDGTNIYLTGYNFRLFGRPGAIEGRAAISPVDGKLVWLNDCHGDSYDTYPMNGVLYSVGHAHECIDAGSFADGPLRHAVAERVTRGFDVNGNLAVNTTHPGNRYWSFANQPRSSVLSWYPNFSNAICGTSYSGACQNGWSVTGNGSYLAIGGEFTHVRGASHVGLVRFGPNTTVSTKYTPVTGARLLDTRQSSPMAANSFLDIQVAGRAGVPTSGVEMVELNIAVASATQSTYVSVGPSDPSRTPPSTALLSAVPGVIVDNGASVRLSSTGAMQLYNAFGNTNVVVDIVGYYSSNGSYVMSSTGRTRIYDSRYDPANNYAPIAPGGARTLAASGVCDSRLRAMKYNVTVIPVSGSGYITTTPVGVQKYPISQFSYNNGEMTAHSLVATMGGGACPSTVFYNHGSSAHIVVDEITAYVDPTITQPQPTTQLRSKIVTITPSRIADTRNSADSIFGKLASDQDKNVQVTGRFGIPRNASKAMVIVTGLNAPGGYMFAYPKDFRTAMRAGASLILSPSRPVSNSLVVPIDQSTGTITVGFSGSGSADAVVDIVGYIVEN